MKKTFLFYFVLLTLNLCAQNHDNIWLLGYGGGSQSVNDTTFGISILQFTEGDLHISNNQFIEMNFNDTDASVADSLGNLLFYFNGIYIEDHSFNTMLNGEELNEWNLTGYDLPQGGLILPYPEHPNQYILIHETLGWVDPPAWWLEVLESYYSIIDMTGNGGLGEVILKKEPLIIDTLEAGKIVATKHANGRDWWIVLNESHSNRYYSVLLAPEGLTISNSQTIGLPTEQGLGQSVFSPDGRFYIMFNTVDTELGQFVEIYDFDRCSGDLSNHRRIQYDEDAFSGGVGISPNSRFLYISSYQYIYQYDLWADDIEATKETVAIYDGYEAPFATHFYLAQLAPDGKIYLSCSNGVTVLHVIHQPNEKGFACNVEQHGIHLPIYNGASMPNFPNFRLGPLDGSSCDTLGLDNLPIAKFRYDQDTLDYLNFEFTDLSYYEPAAWEWDFGDGFTSQDTCPVHAFQQSGVYEVCLTVSNVNGMHTHCRTLNLGITALEDHEITVDLTIFPNPTSDYLYVSLYDYLPQKAQFILYDVSGKIQEQKNIQKGINQFDFTALLPGMYFYEIKDSHHTLKKGKLLIVR